MGSVIVSMEGLRKLDVLTFSGYTSENWRRFQTEFDIYVNWSDHQLDVSVLCC